MESVSRDDAATAPVQASGPQPPVLTMGLWGFYFVAKLALYWLELIDFHVLENLVFALFILIPIGNVFVRLVKHLVTAVLSIALLYQDSWLPGIDLDRMLSQAVLVSDFSGAYLLELIGRFYDYKVVALLGVMGALYWIASRWVKLDALVVLAIMATWGAMFYRDQAPQDAGKFAQFTGEQTDWYDQAFRSEPAVQAVMDTQAGQAARGGPYAQPVPSDLDNLLVKFYEQEEVRSVSFPSAASDDMPFDVIFLNVCSLSWDDLKMTGLELHPLLNRFDILLTRFNSTSAYSGPSVIRMLRAPCGQAPHDGLYRPASDNCYLMGNLKRAGYEPSLVLNHDGRFDNFLKQVQEQDMAKVAPMPLKGLTIKQHAFDDTPVYEDAPVLNQWLENRQESAVPRVAMFYNTITLHNGVHFTTPEDGRNSRENFELRLKKMLDDLDGFLLALEKSGRRAVVVMVPEHGAALRGDRMQIPGLREIPTPAITLVPVGIKVVGDGVQRRGSLLRIGKTTSYLAVSHIVARMLEKSPFSNGSFVPADYVAGLPVTPFVSQNEGAVMLGLRGRYYLRQGDEGWIDYTDI